MHKNKIVRFLHSLVILPILTLELSGNTLNLPKISPSVGGNEIVFLQKNNTGADNPPSSNQEPELEAQILARKGEAIDAYFRLRGMPLLGKGRKMAEEAEKNGLDWRLLAAITVRESTGGKFACQKAKFNAFGWGSCKIGFGSHEEAIETVARNLGGNNPKTARRYGGKNTRQILQTYNPPAIVPRYADQVLNIMNTISSPDVLVEKEVRNRLEA